MAVLSYLDVVDVDEGECLIQPQHVDVGGRSGSTIAVQRAPLLRARQPTCVLDREQRGGSIGARGSFSGGGREQVRG
jgi:hypothetical protein